MTDWQQKAEKYRLKIEMYKNLASGNNATTPQKTLDNKSKSRVSSARVAGESMAQIKKNATQPSTSFGNRKRKVRVAGDDF